METTIYHLVLWVLVACQNTLSAQQVHGGYSKWSDWSQCSQSCGRGKQYRIRFCTNPWPEHGGRDCSNLGSRIDLRTCNIRRCPVHGGYSQWSAWSLCNKSCGLGRKFRYRSCTNPRPAYGGRQCSSFGRRGEWRICNIQRCPAVHGGYSQWSQWSQCNKTCPGRGTQHRYRFCTNPRPAYGGQVCSRLGPAKESQTCNVNGHQDLRLCNKGRVGVCGSNQWIFRCKFTDSNCSVYYSTCRIVESIRLITCDPTPGLHLTLECCDIQCPQ